MGERGVIGVWAITGALSATLVAGCIEPDATFVRPKAPPAVVPSEPEPIAPTPETPRVGDECLGHPTDATPCTVGTGACRVGGALHCIDGVVVCSVRPQAPGVERCSAAPTDEDCDGLIDEALTCCADGREATPERCNDVDDDCDGATDEELDCCHIDPAGERCNGTDDDCDGQIDEEIAEVGTPCEGAVGVCLRPGEITCDPIAGLICRPFDAEVGVEDGTCDGIDDDCNGAVDDAPPCNGAPFGSVAVAPRFGDLGLPEHPWVLVPPHIFLRGTDDPRALDHEGPAQRVELTHTMMVASTEVSVAEWRAITQTEPALRSGCDDCPVERVSWYEAVRFANLLTAFQQIREPDLTPCYELVDCVALDDFGQPCPDAPEFKYQCTGLYRCADVIYDSTCTGYRLLTETEWEAATRAGSSGLYWFGDEDADLRTHENCALEGNPTEPGEARPPNAFGLRHTLGNVGEWVFDQANDYLAPPAPVALTDPLACEDGPWQGSGPDRIYRGHSPHAVLELCRSTGRRFRRPLTKNFEMGLRLARTLPARRDDEPSDH